MTISIRRDRRSKLAALLLGAAFAAALALPAGAQEKVFRMPYFADIGSFDPDNAFEVGGLGAVNGIYEGLVEYKPGTTEIVGLLAKSWEVSDDQLTYTFNLADGVTFHDGTPMDAAAVKTAFERRKTNELTLSYFLWNVASMETPDAKTFVIKLGMPQPSFLDALASPWGPKVISPKALAEHAGSDNATSWLNDNAVGTGPFKLASFARGEEIVLDRNEAYYGAAPYFDQVQLPIVPDIGQQILQLRSGEIDAVPNNYPWNQLAALPPDLESDRRAEHGAGRGGDQERHGARRSGDPEGGAHRDEPGAVGRAGLWRLRHAGAVGLPGGHAQAGEADRLPGRHGGRQGDHREGRRAVADPRRAGRRGAECRHRRRPDRRPPRRDRRRGHHQHRCPRARSTRVGEDLPQRAGHPRSAA